MPAGRGTSACATWSLSRSHTRCGWKCQVRDSVPAGPMTVLITVRSEVCCKLQYPRRLYTVRRVSLFHGMNCENDRHPYRRSVQGWTGLGCTVQIPELGGVSMGFAVFMWVASGALGVTIALCCRRVLKRFMPQKRSQKYTPVRECCTVSSFSCLFLFTVDARAHSG